MQENFVIYNEEYVLIKEFLEDLKSNSGADIVFISDNEGHCIASAGEMEDMYLNSISSLIAGTMAAVNGIAQMLETPQFNSFLSESENKNLYVSYINERTMLVVVFGNASNLGLVRFRVKTTIQDLQKVFVVINEKLESNIFDDDSPFEGVTDEDIDKIFGD